MSNARYLREIANYISAGRGAHCYGTGWEVSGISAAARIMGDEITVTVKIKITSDWVIATESGRRGVENEINRKVNEYVEERLSEYARSHAGVLGEVSPSITIDIQIY